MARDVFIDGKQFATVNELRDAINRNWANISQSLMETFNASRAGQSNAVEAISILEI